MDFLDNARIGTKLIGSFLILAILLGIVAGIGYGNMKNIDNSLTLMYSERLVPVDQLGNTDADFFTLRGDVYKYVAVPQMRDDTLKIIGDDISRVTQDIQQYRTTSLDESEIAELAKFDTNWTAYQSVMKDTLNLIDTGKEQQAIDSLGSGAMSQSRKAVADSLSNLKDINVQQAKTLSTQAEIEVANSTLVIIIIGIVSVIGALALGFVISRSITIPLNTSIEMLTELSRGHLGMRLSLTRKDEVGMMATTMDTYADHMQKDFVGTLHKIATGDKNILLLTAADDKDEISPAFNQTITTINSILEVVGSLIAGAQEGRLKDRGDSSEFVGSYQEIIVGINNMLDSMVTPVNEAMRLAGSYAKGDYTDKINDQLSMKGDFIPFKEALNQIGIAGSEAIGGVKNEIENLTGGMEETNASAQEVGSSTGMLAQSASNVSNLAERSGSGIKQTLTAMEDLSQTVSGVATKAEQASALAKQTVDLSEKGVSLAGKAEKGMEGIMQSVDETGVIITDITNQMEEIGKIVGVISGIADQTGLLALNAAIEAARAGDAGMGFAVVADEVKSLALESQKSAENIATIIGNLQKKSQLVSESMKVSATEVKAGNEAVGETLQVFNQIVEAINQVHNNMTEVAGATEEQAASVEEITASVHEVDSLVQETAQEAVSSAAATEEVTAAIDQVTRAITDASMSIQRISVEMGKFKVV
ncbi:MAG: methyl-accepting chemotaxis protein [Methanobacteriota archaeon]